MSNMTKRALSMSLKRMLNQKRLDDITIQDLVDDAEVSRKTFYYHFQDVYSLLEWIFLDEGKRLLQGNTTADTWQQGLGSVFDYFQENRTMIMNVHRSLQKDDRILKAHVSQLISPILQRIFDAQPNHELVNAEDRQFILKLYSFGLVELFLHWIDDGMKPDAEQLMGKIDRVFSGSMDYLIRQCLEK